MVRRTVMGFKLERTEEALTEYTLDADATQIEGEQREAQWTYKGVHGYMPMLGFLFENGFCLLDEFQEGAARNASPSGGQVAFYQACRKRLPKGKRIARYRADSASYQADLINELEGGGVVWAITADQDCAVKAVVGAIPKERWREPVRGCGYEVAETVHTMGKTEKAFRLIVKRETRRQLELFEEGPYRYHAVATNWPGDGADAL